MQVNDIVYNKRGDKRVVLQVIGDEVVTARLDNKDKFSDKWKRGLAMGEKYWTVMATAKGLEVEEGYWEDDEYDHSRAKQSLIFKKEKEAQEALEKMLNAIR